MKLSPFQLLELLDTALLAENGKLEPFEGVFLCVTNATVFEETLICIIILLCLLVCSRDALFDKTEK